jgi:hypothetical protein
MKVKNLYTGSGKIHKSVEQFDFQIKKWANGETKEFKVGSSTLIWATSVNLNGNCDQGQIGAVWQNTSLADL